MDATFILTSTQSLLWKPNLRGKYVHHIAT